MLNQLVSKRQSHKLWKKNKSQNLTKFRIGILQSSILGKLKIREKVKSANGSQSKITKDVLDGRICGNENLENLKRAKPDEVKTSVNKCNDENQFEIQKDFKKININNQEKDQVEKNPTKATTSSNLAAQNQNTKKPVPAAKGKPKAVQSNLMSFFGAPKK